MRITKEVNLRDPFDKRHSVAVEPSFPLTLTLSLGEREPPQGACIAHTGFANSVAGTAERRRTILPLPRGEGRGEGNENVAHPTVPGGNSALTPRRRSSG